MLPQSYATIIFHISTIFSQLKQFKIHLSIYLIFCNFKSVKILFQI